MFIMSPDPCDPSYSEIMWHRFALHMCSWYLYWLFPLWVSLRFAWVGFSPSVSNNLAHFTASIVTGECWIPEISSICFCLMWLLNLLAITRELQKEINVFEYSLLSLPSSSVVFHSQSEQISSLSLLLHLMHSLYSQTLSKLSTNITQDSQENKTRHMFCWYLLSSGKLP